MGDVVYRLFDLINANRSFFESAVNTSGQFVFIKGLTRTVLFNDTRHNQFSSFKGSETFTTGLAFAATASLLAISDKAGIDNFRIVFTAERTMHSKERAFKCKSRAILRYFLLFI